MFPWLDSIPSGLSLPGSCAVSGNGCETAYRHLTRTRSLLASMEDNATCQEVIPKTAPNAQNRALSRITTSPGRNSPICGTGEHL